MHQHVSKLILNFNFSKIIIIIIFLYFDAHKIDTINQISTILKKGIFRVLHSDTLVVVPSKSLLVLGRMGEGYVSSLVQLI